MPGAFVGRRTELERLSEAWAEARRGAGSFVVLSGEPGIGKTRLAEELARRARSDGNVAWGRSWEGEGTPAYWPWLQILRELQALPSLSGIFSSALERDPELSALLGAPPGVAADPEQACFRLFDAVTRLLAQAARVEPILLLLDDLHAADHSTLALLQFLARALRGARLLVIGTTRQASFHPSARATELLARCTREALHLSLGRLQRDELAEWMRAVEPRLAGEVDRLLETSEGNPLFVAELIAAASRRPEVPPAWAHQVPFGIREAVREHLALCGEPAQRVLETASALGREARFQTVAALSGDPAAARRAVEEAVAAGVLEPLDEARVRFSHVLLRDELYARIGDDRRRSIHAAAATVLRREGADDAALAHHALLGAGEDPGEAVATVLAAMQQARVRFAFEDAVRLGERALLALSTRLAARDECALRIALGEAHLAVGEVAAARAEQARAVELAAGTGDGELLARAALASASEITFGRNNAAIALLRRALAGLGDGDSTFRAEVMGRLAAALDPGMPGEGEEMLRLGDESVAMARRVGDEATLFATLRYLSSVYPERLAPRERFAINAEMIALAQRLGQVPRVAHLFSWQVAGCLELGDHAGAVAQVATAERLLGRFTQPYYRWRIPLVRALLAIAEGRFPDADRELREILRIAVDSDLKEALLIGGVARMTYQYNRGDNDGWDDFAAVVDAHHGGITLYKIFRALPDAMSGQVESVRAALRELQSMPPQALEAIPGVQVLALPALQAGLDEMAGFFYPIVKRRTAKFPLLLGPGGIALGPSQLLLGRLAAVLGDEDAALAHYREALALSEKISLRPSIAQIQFHWAELEKKRGSDGWRARAEIARSIARELGMRGFLERVEKLLGDAPAPAPISRELPSLEKNGDLWTLTAGATAISLKDGKGLGYLQALLRDPHRELHVLELVGSDERGDAGPLLDARAKAAYRARADELSAELDEATRDNDPGRVERARRELDALGAELSRAVGLGGRDRKAGSAAERARVNVQRRLRDVLDRIAEHDPALGRHLEKSIRTGLFCVYSPVPYE
jgi:tetratricopeptide (TPR) repeat protein